MTGRLAGGHVSATGGSRGILARRSSRKPSPRAPASRAVDLDRKAGEAFVAGLADRDRVHFEGGDIRRIDDITRVHAAGVAKFGRVTGLVSNAGATPMPIP